VTLKQAAVEVCLFGARSVVRVPAAHKHTEHLAYLDAILYRRTDAVLYKGGLVAAVLSLA
jgi:hypothetical protein